MSDKINPDVYQGFSNGAQVIDISENLNSNGGQAVQYIARSTRINGAIKGDPIGDLQKAQWFISREIERISTDEVPLIGADIEDQIRFKVQGYPQLFFWEGPDLYNNDGEKLDWLSLVTVAESEVDIVYE